MATARVHEESRQHKKSENVRCKKICAYRSIFGVIDQTKECIIYWLCDDGNTSMNHYEISNVKLCGIVGYLTKISDINSIRELHDQNVFLIVDFASFKKHFDQLAVSNTIRLIYVYKEHDINKCEENKSEQFIECPKVSHQIVQI